jgi:hypothetical protein
MGDVISILRAVRGADRYRSSPDLVDAVRAYQRWQGLDLSDVDRLVAGYSDALAELRPRAWRMDQDWIQGMAAPMLSLRSLAAHMEELTRWPIANEGVEAEFQTIQELLAQSRRLIDRVRQPGRSRTRRLQALDELRRLGNRLETAAGALAVAGR